MKIKAKKSLGQNFLQDTNILEQIATYYDIFGQNILEVGPGYGALTEYLLQNRPALLHLVELDRDMINILNGRVKNNELRISDEIDFQIFQQDVLKFVPNFKGKVESGKLKVEICTKFRVESEKLKVESIQGEDVFCSKTECEVGDGYENIDIAHLRFLPTQEGQKSEREGIQIPGRSRSSILRRFTPKDEQRGGQEEYVVIANIPYYITSPILTHFLYTLKNSPQKMLIMMQREVGERILEGRITNEELGITNDELQVINSDGKGSFFAEASNDKSQSLDGKGENKKSTISPLEKGGRGITGGQNLVKNKKIKSSVLSLMIAKKCFVEKVCDVPRTAFHPTPKVDSIVLAFETHNLFQEIPDETFLEFIKICFAQPRKKLLNNLVSGGYNKEKVLSVLKELCIDEEARGEELSVKDMIELIHFFVPKVHNISL